MMVDGPAPEVVLAWYRAPWRVPVATALLKVESLADDIEIALRSARGAWPALARQLERRAACLREEIIATAIKALRLHPDFGEREAILVHEQGMLEPEAGRVVLLELAAETGEPNLLVAIRKLLRDVT